MSTILLSFVYIFFCCNVYGDIHPSYRHDRLISREQHFPAHIMYRNYDYNYIDYDTNDHETDDPNTNPQSVDHAANRQRRPRAKLLPKIRLKTAGKKVAKTAGNVLCFPTTMAGYFCRSCTDTVVGEVEELAEMIETQPVLKFLSKKISKLSKEYIRQPWFDWKIYYVEQILSVYIKGGIESIDKDVSPQFKNILGWMRTNEQQVTGHRRGKTEHRSAYKKRLKAEQEQSEVEKIEPKGFRGILSKLRKAVTKVYCEISEISKATVFNMLENKIKPWIIGILKTSFKCTVETGWNVAKWKMSRDAGVQYVGYDYSAWRENDLEQESAPEARHRPLIDLVTHWLDQNLFDQAATIANQQYDKHMDRALDDVDKKMDEFFSEEANTELEGSVLLCIKQWLKEEVKDFLKKSIEIMKMFLDITFNNAKRYIAQGAGLNYNEEFHALNKEKIKPKEQL